MARARLGPDACTHRSPAWGPVSALALPALLFALLRRHRSSSLFVASMPLVHRHGRCCILDFRGHHFGREITFFPRRRSIYSFSAFCRTGRAEKVFVAAISARLRMPPTLPGFFVALLLTSFLFLFRIFVDLFRFPFSLQNPLW